MLIRKKEYSTFMLTPLYVTLIMPGYIMYGKNNKMFCNENQDQLACFLHEMSFQIAGK